jgi:beta-N-acetylhexosaminidase
MRAKSIVVGIAGPELTGEEVRLLERHRPFGVILFRRNVQDRDQLRALITSLRDVLAPEPVAVLVDQEGGRVARLRPPIWYPLPPVAELGALAEQDIERAEAAARCHAGLIAHDLREVGVDVVCAPVLDVAPRDVPGAIGDRAISADPAVVTTLGAAMVEAFLDGGILPVIKHLPGQGRARADSHTELPIVTAPRAALADVDFRPFRAMASAPFGMTGHVLFTALDPQRPATLSPVVIEQVIRGAIGFQGALFSDDLGMGALSGTIGDRVRRCLAAGCDLALQCSGVADALAEALDAASWLDGAAAERCARALRARRPSRPFSVTAARAILERLPVRA